MVVPSSPHIGVATYVLAIRVGFLCWVSCLLMPDNLLPAEVSLWRENQIGILRAVDAHAHFKVCVHLPLWVLAAVSPRCVFVHITCLIAKFDRVAGATLLWWCHIAICSRAGAAAIG